MLPKELQEEAVLDLVRMSGESAFEALKGEVPGEKRAEFQKLLELSDDLKAESFLKTHVPHFQEIVTATTKEELEKFKHALIREQQGGSGESA